MAKAKKDEEVKEEVKTGASDILSGYLKANKQDHLNFTKQKRYKVSSGSLLLDIEIPNFGPGIVNATGISGGGKSSCGFSYMFNFLQDKSRPRRGILNPAEGRLSEEIRERSGIKFVDKAEDWVDGTCFIYRSNVFESVIGLLRQLVINNPEEIEYFVIIDSTNALVPRGDVDRDFSESNKVAGGALLTSDFLRKMSLAMNVNGHIVWMISQVRSKVSLNPYEKTDPKLSNNSGGSAQIHYADYILEFQPRYKADEIIEKVDGKDTVVGHWAKAILRKSNSDKNVNKEVRWPICHGRTGGTSVWVEYELVDVMLMYQLLSKAGAWFATAESFMSELKAAGFEFPEKFQGINNIRKHLEENPALTKHLFDKFRSIMS